MIRKNTKWIMILSVLAGAFLLNAAAFGAESVTAIGNAGQATASDCKNNIPVIELPIPQGDAEKGYLGLSGKGNFRIGEINSRIVIVQVYSFYCPHCQRMASQVNEIYREIESRNEMKGKIKMIGIGAKNSAYEVDSYRERYQVPFPLFPDKTLELTEKLCVKGTPTFIGFKVDGKGAQEQFYFGEGGFPDVRTFLSEVVRAAGLK